MVPAFSNIQIAGDPVLRGLSGKPTLMTTADVQQGAGQDTNVARALQSMSDRYTAYFTSSGPTDPYTQPELPATDPTPAVPVDKGSEDCSQYEIGSWDWSQCMGRKVTGTNKDGSSSIDCSAITGSDMLMHPVDSMNCLLNRFLFGLVALVLLGFGLYLFAKD